MAKVSNILFITKTYNNIFIIISHTSNVDIKKHVEGETRSSPTKRLQPLLWSRGGISALWYIFQYLLRDCN